MQAAGFEFAVIESCVDEDATGDCATRVEALAIRKARAVQGQGLDDAVIIAADTLVALDELVLEKPADHADAFVMLKSLQGRRHTVFTGVAIIFKGKVNSFVEAADVYFRELDDDEINDYINTGEPFDKAGGYGIQGRGATLVRRVEGCFYAVMGLPMARLCDELKKLME